MNLVTLRVARKSALALAVLLSLATPLFVAAQDPAAPTPATSHEVHPDGTITFRYKDVAATKVELNLEGQPKPIPMEKSPDGIWSVTSPALTPEIYGYTFHSDKSPRLDPANTRITTNLVNVSNMVEVPGPAPQLWDAANVPHGVLHHHAYNTGVVLGVTNNQSDYFVYTPPSYDPKAKFAWVGGFSSALISTPSSPRSTRRRRTSGCSGSPAEPRMASSRRTGNSLRS